MKNVRSIPTNVHATKPYISLRKFLVFKGIKTALKNASTYIHTWRFSCIWSHFQSHLYFLSLQVFKKINHKHLPNRSVQSYLSFILGFTP